MHHSSTYLFSNNFDSIACCTIKPFVVIDTDDGTTRRHLEAFEEDIDILTLEDYKELFGVEYDPADWEPESFLN